MLLFLKTMCLEAYDMRHLSKKARMWGMVHTSRENRRKHGLEFEWKAKFWKVDGETRSNGESTSHFYLNEWKTP